MSVSFDQAVTLFKKVYGRHPNGWGELGRLLGSKEYDDLSKNNMLVWDHEVYKNRQGRGPTYKFCQKGEPLRFSSHDDFLAHFDFHGWGCKHRFFNDRNHFIEGNIRTSRDREWVYFLGALPHSDREDKASEVEVVPLYIGRTTDLQGRLNNHRRSQHWWNDVDFVWAIPFDRNEQNPSAGDYEMSAIHRFQPVHSKQAKRKRAKKKEPPVAIISGFGPLDKTSMNGDDWFEYYTGETSD